MSSAHERVLAIDLGEVRVGLALSDPLGITAQPAGRMRRTSAARDVQAIADLVREHDVKRVVVGYPLLLSGEIGARAQDAVRFAAVLKPALPGVDIELWDERFTSAEAERLMISGNVRRRRRKEVVDTLAAVLILQGFLEQHGGSEVR